MTGESPLPSPYAETERQAAELAAMRRMLEASRGTFSLSIAICNSPALRDYVIGRVQSGCDDVELIHLPDSLEDVFEHVGHSAQCEDQAALFLVNLEKSLPSSMDEHPILRRLNATRELWKESYACPVVLWVPEYTATLLSEHARDLWAWRSHQFEFLSELAEPVAAMADSFAGDAGAVSNLDADRKRFRIAELEQRIAEAGDPSPPGLAPHVSIWLNELGVLFHMIGDLAQAEASLWKALKIEEEGGRVEGMAVQYGNLGVIYRRRDDLEKAEEFHRKSLKIEEQLGRFEGMAIQYGSLGVVYGVRGDLEEAEEFLRKSLEIHEQLGHLEGMADQYGNLGLIYRRRGDLPKAEEFLRKSLEINEQLGCLRGMGHQYGNLGTVHVARGDVELAREYWNKALELFEKIGMEREVRQTQALLDKLPDGDGPESSGC